MFLKIFAPFVPNPGGAVWIALLVAFIAFADHARWRSRRNLSLCALLLLAPVMADIMRYEDDPGSRMAALAFTLVFLLTAAYAAWGVALSRQGDESPWPPNLSARPLRVLLGIVLLLDLTVVLGRHPDDAGYYTNLGARRWAETGTIPYADLKLRGPDAPGYGASATYGPLLYVAHMPFQLLVGADRNPPEMDPKSPAYVRPPVLATQLTCYAFLLLGVFSLFLIVRRAAGEETALAAAALYAGSPYVLGLGGAKMVIGGLAFISHIAPSAVMLAALALAHRPFASGMTLAAATGVLFYPVFAFPAWFGWRLWRRDSPWRFALGFAVAGALIATLVVLSSRGPGGEDPLRSFLQSTLEHQEGTSSREYGASKFGFWGTHPGLASYFQVPVFGSSSLFKPTFLLYALFSASCFFLARGRTLVQLAGLTAALAAAVQLWKTHAAGSYVEWYLPFLIVALVAGGERAQDAAKAESPPASA
jgi:hypothetical protein